MAAQTKVQTPPRSLREYIRARRRVDCKVCNLEPALATQLKQAGKSKISVADRLAWLREEWGITITPSELELHTKGGHDVG